MIVDDPNLAAARHHDVVVIGGGIVGAAVLHEAASQGLSACLLEAEDFGGGTTWNSLRILHGGLRYLQSANLVRFRESVIARRSMAIRFPTLVRPLECLMPLYGVGLKRRPVLSAALACNDLLSARANEGVHPELRLARGRTLDAPATLRAAPLVRRERLQGAAVWYDHRMVSSERIVIELLRDACRCGSVALNYARVQKLLKSEQAVCGVEFVDRIRNRTGQVLARAVVDCTGARVGQLASDDPQPDPHQHFLPSLAFNVLLDFTLDSARALAVTTPDREGTVFFLVPQARGTLAGTMHLPRARGTVDANPSEAEIAAFIRRLDAAIPALGLTRRGVAAVFAGLLPVRSPGSVRLQLRESIVAHEARPGLAGYCTVAGVKFTTAVVAARRVLAAIDLQQRARRAPEAEIPLSPVSPMLTDAVRFLQADPEAASSALRRVIGEEAVRSLDDLLARRTNWLSSGHDGELLRARVSALTGLPPTAATAERPAGAEPCSTTRSTR